MKTLSQQRAAFAYRKVSGHGATYNHKSKYAIWVKKLGGLIQQSGLLAAIALAEQKAGTEPGIKDLLSDLRETPGLGVAVGGDFSKAVAETDFAGLMQATDSLFDVLVFFKAFCTSVMEANPDTQEDER